MLALDIWNKCFHLLLGNTSGHAKQHNQHSWLFGPLVPLISPGVLLDSHSQQATGKPKKVSPPKSVLGKVSFATLLEK